MSKGLFSRSLKKLQTAQKNKQKAPSTSGGAFHIKKCVSNESYRYQSSDNVSLTHKKGTLGISFIIKYFF